MHGELLILPETDGFTADSDAAFSEEIFDIPMAEVESVVEPNSVGDDIRRESMAFVCIHEPIVSISAT